MTELPADLEAKIRAGFDAQSMMATFGASLNSISKGEVAIRAPILEGARQQQGFGHAALTFALGDTAAGFAALSIMEAGADVLTTELKINLIAPAMGDYLEAVGRVIKPGRRLVVVQSDVYAIQDGTRRHIALLTGSMMPVTPKKNAG